MDLTGKLQPDGTLAWEVPAGEWTIVRTGYTTTGHRVSCSTKGGEGPEMDWLDTRAMYEQGKRSYLQNVQFPLWQGTWRHLLFSHSLPF